MIRLCLRALLRNGLVKVLLVSEIPARKPGSKEKITFVLVKGPSAASAIWNFLHFLHALLIALDTLAG